MNTSVRFPNLDIDFSFVGRSVSVFGFELTFFGLLTAAGMLLGLAVMIFVAKKQKEDPNLSLEAMIPAFAGGVLGARLMYVALNREMFAGKSIIEIADIRNGGMSIYGGILGGILIGAIYCKIRKISFAQVADTASMGFLTAQIIAVWGNFFNREGFGEYTDSLLAMQIPADAVNKAQISRLMAGHLAEADGISWIQVHPLFLYESIWCLALFLILLLYTKHRKYPGEIFLRYLAGYSLGRAGIEFLLPEPVTVPGTEIPVFSCVLLVLAVMFGITASVRRSLTKKRERHRARRREEKRAVLNYDDIQTYEDVSHEFMGTDITDEIKETEEKEVPEDAEVEEKTDQRVSAGSGSRTEEVESEKTETEDTELPQKAERDDPEQGRPSQMSEGKPEA